MNHAESVREYCGRIYIAPARAAGQSELEIRAGDVHSALGFSNRLPLVCSAIGAKKFEDTFGVRRIGVEGPMASTTTLFKFAIK